MSKPARRKDQAAIDMVTIGTFLSVSGSTYAILSLAESIVEKGEEVIETITTEAGEVAKGTSSRAKAYEMIVDIVNAPNNPLLQTLVRRAARTDITKTLRSLGWGRKGGIL